ncbi:hypothetical protein TNCT_207331 [Trichonephila clavata]|uniref:Uncharacterized protein n=1 Tax=Trichonephila clavata TaxID=2740835 RepID=A0A8X6KHK7_TRICU|nr:hypothetical protein TNCT_207331 [Trichonephila clavata]
MLTILSPAACGIAIKIGLQYHEDLVLDILGLQQPARTIIGRAQHSQNVVKSSGIVMSRPIVHKRLHLSHVNSRRPTAWFPLTDSISIGLQWALDHIH